MNTPTQDTSAAIVSTEAGIIPASSPESLTTEQLVEVATGAFQRLQDSMPFIIELRKRFNAAPRGKANIADCDTWEQFCEKQLHRTASALRKALQAERVSGPYQDLKDEAEGIKTELNKLHLQFMDLQDGNQRFLEFPTHLCFLSGDRKPRYRMTLDFSCRENIQHFIDTLKKGLDFVGTAVAPAAKPKKTPANGTSSNIGASNTYVVNELTETFYMVRRKTDGRFLGRGGFKEFNEADDRSKEIKTTFPLLPEWEWVKVSATYQLTAVPTIVAPAAPKIPPSTIVKITDVDEKGVYTVSETRKRRHAWLLYKTPKGKYKSHDFQGDYWGYGVYIKPEKTATVNAVSKLDALTFYFGSKEDAEQFVRETEKQKAQTAVPHKDSKGEAEGI